MRAKAPLTHASLARRLDGMGVSLPENAVSGLAVYLGLLAKWNRAMNLVGTRSWEETLETLVADSFHLAAFLPGLGLPENPAVFDLGAGAGLPGIPLRLVWHDGEYTLVEVREKRALFMQTALAALNLERTRVFRGRAEDFFAHSRPADCVISRAFMPWRELLAFVAEALAPEGRVVFLALAPVPEDLPAPWKPVAQKAYAIGGAARYFWCLAREGV